MKKLIVVYLFACSFQFLFGGNKIAIMPFKDSSYIGSYSNLVQSIPDMLTTNLARSKNIILVERIQIDKAIKNFKIEKSGMIDLSTAVDIGKWLGADYLLLGNFIAIGDDVRIDVRAVDIVTGTIASTNNISGKNSQLFSLIDNLAIKIANKFENNFSPIVLNKEYIISFSDISDKKVLFQYNDPTFEENNFLISINGLWGTLHFKNGNSQNWWVGHSIMYNNVRIADLIIRKESTPYTLNYENEKYKIEITVREINHKWYKLPTRAYAEISMRVGLDTVEPLFRKPEVCAFESSRLNLKIIRKDI